MKLVYNTKIKTCISAVSSSRAFFSFSVVAIQVVFIRKTDWTKFHLYNKRSILFLAVWINCMLTYCPRQSVDDKVKYISPLVPATCVWEAPPSLFYPWQLFRTSFFSYNCLPSRTHYHHHHHHKQHQHRHQQRLCCCDNYIYTFICHKKKQFCQTIFGYTFVTFAWTHRESRLFKIINSFADSHDLFPRALVGLHPW